MNVRNESILHPVQEPSAVKILKDLVLVFLAYGFSFMLLFLLFFYILLCGKSQIEILLSISSYLFAAIKFVFQKFIKIQIRRSRIRFRSRFPKDNVELF